MKNSAQRFQRHHVRWRVVVAMGLVNLGIYLVFPNCAAPGNPGPDPPFPVKVIAAPIMAPTGLVVALTERAEEASERRELKNRKLTPESEWNRYRTWEKVSASPPSYVPRGYASSAPQGDRGGTWYVDARDGKRLFAPHTTFRDCQPGVWHGEAKKITANR